MYSCSVNEFLIYENYLLVTENYRINNASDFESFIHICSILYIYILDMGFKCQIIQI